MAASSTAQVVFKGNTADLQKKLKVAEKGMQEFKDMGSDALSSIGDLFGVNTGKIGDMLGSVKKLSAGFQAMGSTGNSALTGLTRGAAMLSAGVAAIGIAGLVAGFKELNRQAELFAQTDIGSDFLAVQQGWRDTYAMATMQANQNRASSWTRFWQEAKTTFQRGASVFGNTFAGGLNAQSLSSALGVDRFAKEAADAAKPYLETLEDAKDALRDQSMSWAENTTKIKEYRRIAVDTAKSEEERNDAIKNAIILQQKINDERTEAYKKIYEAQKAVNEQSPTPEAGIQDLVNKYNEWQEAAGTAASELSQLEKIQNRINKNSDGGSGVSSTTTEVDHLAEAIDGLYASIQSAIDVNRTFGGVLSDEDVTLQSYRSSLENIVATYGVEDERIKTLIADYKKLQQERVFSAPLASVSAPTAAATITPAATQSGVAGQMQGIAGWKMPELTSEQRQYYEFLQGMVDATEKANEAISDALVNGISNSIQYLADALWGLEEFDGSRVFAALLTPLAEACVQMGELIMAQGLASKAFQESLSNPYAAIAAGAALIAVGALVKAGLNSAIKSVSGGGYSTSVASSA